MEPSHHLFINLEVVLSKSQSKAWLQCKAEMCSSCLSCRAATFWGYRILTVYPPCFPISNPTLPTVSESLEFSCHLIQDFSGGSFHCVDIRKEENLVGWHCHETTSEGKHCIENNVSKAWLLQCVEAGQHYMQLLLVLHLGEWLASITQKRPWNKHLCLKACRDRNS